MSAAVSYFENWEERAKGEGRREEEDKNFLIAFFPTHKLVIAGARLRFPHFGFPLFLKKEKGIEKNFFYIRTICRFSSN